MKLEAAIKETRYIIFSIYNYKNSLLEIKINDLPYDAIELYKRENMILAYKRDIADIIEWSV